MSSESETIYTLLIDSLLTAKHAGEIVSLLNSTGSFFLRILEKAPVPSAATELGLTDEEVGEYQKLILFGVCLLLFDQVPSGSWGRTIELFADTYLRTYDTSLRRREGLPVCPEESPTFLRYAVDALKKVAPGYPVFAPRSLRRTCRNLEELLSTKSRIVRSAPPAGQSGRRKYFIDYHHTTTAAHGYLLATGDVGTHPLKVLDLLGRHVELWLKLYKEEAPADGAIRSPLNFAGVHLADYAYFLSDLLGQLPARGYAEQRKLCNKLLDQTIAALLEGEDERDHLWGAPEHARPMRAFWVLENVSKASPERFAIHFEDTVREMCELRDLLHSGLVGAKCGEGMIPGGMCLTLNSEDDEPLPSLGLTACLALLSHRLAKSSSCSDAHYFEDQNRAILRDLINTFLRQPQLLVNRSSFTFTWACLAFLNEMFGFDYTPAVEHLKSLETSLQSLDTPDRNEADWLRTLWTIAGEAGVM